jgi:hypothetical protein
MRLNSLSVVTNRCLDQSPEVEARWTGAIREIWWQEQWVNGKRVCPVDETVRLGSGKTPEGVSILDVATG